MKPKTVIRVMVMVLLLSFCTAITYAATEKTLFFNKKDGKLYYDNESSQSIDTFLNFQNMNLNQTYEDSLKIKNEADKTYQLFFQILPKDGSLDHSLALLKVLEMKIYNNNELIYQGTADGIAKIAGTLDVQQMVSIGAFEPDQEAMLKVEIKLNIDDSIETQKRYYVKSQYLQWEVEDFDETKEPTSYLTQKEATAAAQRVGDSEITYQEEAIYKDKDIQELVGVMANTTWKFYGENQDAIIPIEPPNTGEQRGDLLKIVLVATVSLGILVFLGKPKRKIH